MLKTKQSLRGRFWRSLRSISLAVVPAMVVACGGDDGGMTGPDNKIASVEVSASAASVPSGGTMQLSAVAKNASGATVGGKTFTWTSSNAAAASVNPAGLVTAIAEGSVTITATETGSGKAGSMSLMVTPPPVASVTVTPATAAINVGATQQLSATLADAGGGTLSGRTITWTSSNAGVATVSSTGLVTGVAAGGPVTITATSEGRSGTAAISVTARQPAILPETITAGGHHTCGLTSAGQAYCWGNKNAGQLGDGTTTARSTPVAVLIPTGVSFGQITAGFAHTCAVASGGSVGAAYCWGSNSDGQLGDGTTTTRTTPVAVQMPSGVSVGQIRAGHVHTCAVASGGSAGAAYCWGINTDGQLGDGTTTTSRTTPVAVQMPSGVSFGQIRVGLNHTCAVASGGSAGAAYCWGINFYGQLGDGTLTNKTTPVAVSGGLTFRP